MRMNTRFRSSRRERGVMLIEALIAILIFSIGILAVVGMQGVAIKSVTDSKMRSDAALLANELIAQMWTDQAPAPNPGNNIALYSYPGSGSVPTRLQAWVARIKAKLPGTTDPAVQPKVSLSPAGGTPNGATVTIQVFWRLPEEASLGLPPHNHTVVASIYF